MFFLIHDVTRSTMIVISYLSPKKDGFNIEIKTKRSKSLRQQNFENASSFLKSKMSLSLKKKVIINAFFPPLFMEKIPGTSPKNHFLH